MKICNYALVCLAFASMMMFSVEAASSSSLRGSDDRTEVTAVPVELASKLRKGNGTSKSAKTGRSSKSSGPTSAPPADVNYDQVDRFTIQARTTLVNVDLDALNPAECMFFEDTWMAAFQAIHGDDESDGANPSFTVRSMIILDAEQPEDRRLRGGSINDRSLYFYHFNGWFDVSALFEITCSFCSSGLDDDDYYYNRRLTDASSDYHLRFQVIFCDMLRDGPFATFETVESCEITFPLS